MERMLHVVDGKVPDTLRKCFSEVYLKIYILFLFVDEVLTLSRVISFKYDKQMFMYRLLLVFLYLLMFLFMCYSMTLITAIFVNLKIFKSTVKATIHT